MIAWPVALRATLATCSPVAALRATQSSWSTLVTHSVYALPVVLHRTRAYPPAIGSRPLRRSQHPLSRPPRAIKFSLNIGGSGTTRTSGHLASYSTKCSRSFGAFFFLTIHPRPDLRKRDVTPTTSYNLLYCYGLTIWLWGMYVDYC